MTEPDYTSNQSTRFHPAKIFMYLTLAGVTMLFLAFSAAYLYSRFTASDGTPPIQLPSIFIFNTIVLIGSSFTLRWAKKCYLADDTKGYQNALLFTTILTFLFMILQIIGWRQLFNQDFFIASSTLTSYIYVISAMHFIHVIAGLPFLILFYYVARKRMKEPVSVLVYFSDPEKRLKLKL
ncbi:MAG: heme-copper oxidase subunit III, partial [Saprospiraceae bacterium]